MEVLPTPGGPKNKNEQAYGLARNLESTRFALGSPTNSATFRGRYFSLRRTGKAKVGVVIAHPPVTLPSVRRGTRWSSRQVERFCARLCPDPFPCSRGR